MSRNALCCSDGLRAHEDALSARDTILLPRGPALATQSTWQAQPPPVARPLRINEAKKEGEWS
jgi:hypothetical protein